MLPLQRIQVQSLVRELRSHMLHGMENKNKIINAYVLDYNNFLKETSFSIWRRKWQPIPVLLPGKSHGWRSLVTIVYGVAKSLTRLSNFIFAFHSHALEKETATHSSVLAWRIPGTGEPGGLPSMGSHRVGHD